AMSKIEKSPQVRLQEEKIAALGTQIKRTKTTIKSLKTRLENTQNRITERQREMASQSISVLERSQALLKTVLETLSRLAKDKRFAQAEQQEFREMQEQFQEQWDMIEEATTQSPPMAEEQTEEERARFQDFFQQFKVEPAKAEQRNIRGLYLKLSKQFHPDKAPTEAKKTAYHELQQQINQAYQNHDLQYLLELEQWYGLADAPPTEKASTDVLQQEIDRLERQLGQLKNQQQRLSAEVKQLRQSDLGQMLTHTDSMERHGFDFGGQTELMIEEMQELADLLQRVDDTGDFQLLMPQEADLEDIFGMFEDHFADILRDNPDPKFPVDTYVSLSGMTVDSDGELLFITRKREKEVPINGYVTEAYLDPEDVPVYGVLMDGRTLQEMPKRYQEDAYFSDKLGYVVGISEGLLSRAKEPEDNRLSTTLLHRKTRLEIAFSERPAAQRKRIVNILTSSVDYEEYQLWNRYFLRHFKLPLNAKYNERIYERFQKKQPPKNIVLEEIQPAMGDNELISFLVKHNGQIFPIITFPVQMNDPKLQQILDDYMVWADYYDVGVEEEEEEDDDFFW
ncbi:MAG: hypothetical protein AAGJ82_02930, partial [Bacteroidota bacterium]